jgi:hypothetical protein
MLVNVLASIRLELVTIGCFPYLYKYNVILYLFDQCEITILIRFRSSQLVQKGQQK